MKSLRLGILSDLHRTTNARERAAFHNDYDFAGHLARVECALDWFRRESIDALLLCGDLTHDADASTMRAVLMECSAGLDVPVIAVAGNHDVAQGEDVLARAIQDAANDQLVHGDPVGVLLSGTRVAGVQVVPTSGYYRSRLAALPAVDAWGDEPVVVLSHLPLLSRASTVAARGMPYPGDLVDREDTAALLRTRDAATIVVAGHIHVRDAHIDGPVLQLAQAAMIEPPFEAAVLDVRVVADGSVLASRITHRTSDQRAAHEPTFVEPIGSWRFANGEWATAELETRAPHELTAVGDHLDVRDEP